MVQFPGWAQMHFHLMLGSLQCRKEMCPVAGGQSKLNQPELLTWSSQTQQPSSSGCCG